MLFERAARGLAGELLQVGTIAVLFAFAVVTFRWGCRSSPRPRWRATPGRIGVEAAVRTNTGEPGTLPQDYADMLGWEEQVAAVARVYHALPADQRARAVIVAGNYGEAGALDFYGPRYGLPPVVSAAGSYWFFGPGDRRETWWSRSAFPRRHLRRVLRLGPDRRHGHPPLGGGGGAEPSVNVGTRTPHDAATALAVAGRAELSQVSLNHIPLEAARCSATGP